MEHVDVGYEGQENWREIQSYLPAQYRLGRNDLPLEEWWSWEGDRIHLDRFRRPEAKARVILFHGTGTNGRQMSTILGKPLFDNGLETVAIDMPGFGATKVARGADVGYDDWVRAGNAFVNAELARDERPIFLYGLSAGGMLAYQVAALNRKVRGIIGMTFLDNRDREVVTETANSKLTAYVAPPLIHAAVKVGLGAVKMPMRSVSKISALVNDQAALEAFLRDQSSAGASVSQHFVDTLMNLQLAQEPEDFDVCPILLTQPAEDRWTPLSVSELFLSRIRKVSVERVMLEGAGHYPLEEPGLTQMRDAILRFVRENA